jgi:DNA-binding NtrC family response regulator
MINRRDSSAVPIDRDPAARATTAVMRLMRILQWEERPGDSEIVREALEAEGRTCWILTVSEHATFERALETHEFDVIVVGGWPGGLAPDSLIPLAHDRQPLTPVVVFTSGRSEELAVEAFHAGAVDYVSRNRALDLAPALARAVSSARKPAARRQSRDTIQI